MASSAWPARDAMRSRCLAGESARVASAIVARAESVARATAGASAKARSAAERQSRRTVRAELLTGSEADYAGIGPSLRARMKETDGAESAVPEVQVSHGGRDVYAPKATGARPTIGGAHVRKRAGRWAKGYGSVGGALRKRKRAPWRGASVPAERRGDRGGECLVLCVFVAVVPSAGGVCRPGLKRRATDGKCEGRRRFAAPPCWYDSNCAEE